MITPASSAPKQPSAPTPQSLPGTRHFGDADPSAGAESWYLTGHLRDEDGAAHTWAVGLLRQRDPQDPAAEPGYRLYVLHRGPGGMSYGTWITPTALRALHDTISSDEALDPRVRRALTEALAQGPLLPDRLLREPVTESSDGLDLRVGDVVSLRREDDGRFRLAFRQAAHFELLLTPVKPAATETESEGDGVGDTAGFASLFLPRLDVRGTLRLGEGASKRVTGQAWFQHGRQAGHGPDPQATGPAGHTWTWTGLHLDNGWEISATAHAPEPADTTSAVLARATAVDPDGVVSHHDMSCEPLRHWTSLATLNTYPTALRLSVPALDLHLDVTAAHSPHEVRTFIVGRAFWESPATARGTMNGLPTTATAVLRTIPNNTIDDIEGYMRRGHGIARDEAAVVYPDTAADIAGVDRLAGTHAGTRLDATAHTRLHQALAAPVLHLLNKPGRSWRAYVAGSVLCLLDTDPEPYRPLTAATEILHTSALVIDDIQDGSTTRRGLPSVHEVFGTAAAITAGTLGYYTFDPLLQRVPQADASTMLRVYQLYLRAMRAAHAGQALDLAGHHSTFDEAIETGDPTALLEQIRTTHRLKTGMLVRSTAEVAAILGGADEAQLAAICDYFENVGLAYQISDDAADLYGMATPAAYRQGVVVRTPALDLINGTVTYPVAQAIGLLDAHDRRRLHRALHVRSEADVADAAELLMSCGALTACLAEARDLVDRTWETLDPLLPHTPHKAMARALGWYAAQRGPENDHVPA
ncbi:polyprenyl synthetase family protein [Streptomyces sp. NBC_01092]|uniref:polyprenyl synthetase family protein n=1 Tax=Streptomyces sp. NBC_01092 TaxID=2903748 RepID=UPI00386AEA5A|nr:polyprenyl synthetase family protein [Streptomyces sp. NBC_01092]